VKFLDCIKLEIKILAISSSAFSFDVEYLAISELLLLPTLMKRMRRNPGAKQTPPPPRKRIMKRRWLRKMLSQWGSE
jgi:hypothetical protein